MIPVRERKGEGARVDQQPATIAHQGSLNGKQKLVLAIGVGLLIVAILFPPFVFQPRTGITVNSGFSFLFVPSNSAAVVNVSLLSVELVAIVIVTTALFAFFRGR